MVKACIRANRMIRFVNWLYCSDVVCRGQLKCLVFLTGEICIRLLRVGGTILQSSRILYVTRINHSV